MEQIPQMMPGAMPAAPAPEQAAAGPAAMGMPDILAGGEEAPMGLQDEMALDMSTTQDLIGINAEMGDEEGLANLEARQQDVSNKQMIYALVPDMATKPFKVKLNDRKDKDFEIIDPSEVDGLMDKDDPVVDLFERPDGKISATRLSKMSFRHYPDVDQVRREPKAIDRVCVITVDGRAAEIVSVPKDADEGYLVNAKERLENIIGLLETQGAKPHTMWLSAKEFNKSMKK